MNILFLRSNPVNPDSRVEKEVNALLKAGHNVRILAWDRNANYKIKKDILKFDSGEASIYRVGVKSTYGGGFKKNIIPLMRFQIKMHKWIKGNIEWIEAIHACDFDTSFTSSKIAFKYKKKFVYDIFDYYVDAFSVPAGLKKVIENADIKIINSSDAVIICSEKRKNQIIKSSPKKLYVVHNTPPHYEGKSNKFNLDKSRVKIAYVGILDSGRLIEETIEIVKNNPNYEYHIAGFGRLEESIKKISKAYENIIFYGKIAYEDTLNLEKNCDIMLALYEPSNRNHKYAAPNKFYEALMLGKPLIVVKDTGIDEVVVNNSIGRAIEYNRDSLEMALNDLVLNRENWQYISNKSIELYKNNYSWSEMEQRLIELYSKI